MGIGSGSVDANFIKKPQQRIGKTAENHLEGFLKRT
jgi:hypothetical protein